MVLLFIVGLEAPALETASRTKPRLKTTTKWTAVLLIITIITGTADTILLTVVTVEAMEAILRMKRKG